MLAALCLVFIQNKTGYTFCKFVFFRTRSPIYFIGFQQHIALNCVDSKKRGPAK
ncbi:hypothetical protein HMPREF0201_02129 [Cedecea davisae DSM 4568]|uniref:Uncharacterized protein n=1 Tax=Cedecea davisae DSM 4568 TaxID=566551 RepID=S3JUR5_9ENTR|nr:hypothetical protein HMPREF0201_02129 [Cedecea davisae DSM 4568]